MIYDAWGNVTYDYNEELDSLGNLEALNIASINNETMKGREIEKLSKINIKGKLYLFFFAKVELIKAEIASQADLQNLLTVNRLEL